MLRAKKEEDYAVARQKRYFSENMQRVAKWIKVYNLLVEMYQIHKKAVEEDHIMTTKAWINLMLVVKFKRSIRRFGES